MTLRKSFALLACALILLAVCVPGFSQGNRGKAEMKAGGGAITVDYGRPVLKGRDMLSQLKIGDFWRMGSNQATQIKSPVDLMFGTTKIAKGEYSLFMKRTAEDKFELVFNSKTGQWGTQHDPASDVASVPLKKETLSSPVDTMTIELKEGAKGGAFVLSWGTSKLSADFTVGK
jgi:hypothetical protein